MITPARRSLTIVGALAAMTTAAIGLPAVTEAAAAPISAQFNKQSATVTITGNAADNAITVAVGTDGHLTINAGAVPIRGGQPTPADVTTMAIRGLAGDDSIVLDESSGPLPAANITGGDGSDSVSVIGDATAETYSATPAGTGVRVIRTASGTTPIALTTVESLTLNTGGGDDTVTASAVAARRLHLSVDGGTGWDSATITGSAQPDTFGVTPGVADTFVTVSANDYASLQVETVGIDLSGSSAADNVNDSVTVYGTSGADNVTLTGANGTATVSGLAATVNVLHADPAIDTLGVSTGDNADVIDARAVAPSAPRLALDGGSGDDQITGGAGDDTIDAGAGNDVVSGGRGNDVVTLGDGDDVYLVGVAEGNDTVDGGAGHDSQFFYGAEVAEQYGIAANGDHVEFTRTLATNVTVNDLVGVERLVTNLSGGADTVDVGDLTGPGVDDVDFDGRNSQNAPDGAPDSITVHGTPGNDAIDVDSTGPATHVTGLAYLVRFFDSDGPLDTLVVDGADGDDSIRAANLVAGDISFTAIGGNGNDVLVGSPGNDHLFGNDGDDVLVGNGGFDVLDGGTGSNVIIP